MMSLYTLNLMIDIPAYGQSMDAYGSRVYIHLRKIWRTSPLVRSETFFLRWPYVSRMNKCDGLCAGLDLDRCAVTCVVFKEKEGQLVFFAL